MLSEQAFLNAGPLLVKGTAGAAAAGFIFNILMIARAPLQLFQAVSTSLLPHLTRLRAEGADDDFRASVSVTIRAIAAFAGSAAIVMAIAGPDLMQIAFGDNFTYERVDLLIVTVGMGLYLAAATLNQAALAQGQVRRAAVCWIGCAAAFVVWCLVPIVSDEFRRVEVGYLGGAAILCALLYAIYRRPARAARTRSSPARPRSSSSAWPRRTRGARSPVPLASVADDSQLILIAGALLGAGIGAALLGRPGQGPRPAALPRPRDARRVGGDRRHRLRRRRADPDARDDRPDPDPVRGRARRRLGRDPAGPLDGALPGDRRDGPDRGHRRVRGRVDLRPRDARGSDHRLGDSRDRLGCDLRRAARVEPAAQDRALAGGRVRDERPGRAPARHGLHRLDRGARLRDRRHGRRAGAEAGTGGGPRDRRRARRPVDVPPPQLPDAGPLPGGLDRHRRASPTA